MLYYIIGIVVLGILFFLGFSYYKISLRLKIRDKELESLQEKTEQQSQINKQFITSLSQELRTPLYGIMGLTNLLAQEYPKLEENKNLKSLKFSGDYLLTLINNIIQVNHISNEEIKLQESIFDLKEITQNIVQSFSYATANSDNKLHFDFDAAIPNELQGSPSVLSQVLMNLISNALRFTKNGNIFLSVSLITQKESTSNIVFKVKHDGHEVSKEDEKSIYQEFINIESIKKSYLGIGLNTTIVKRLAKSIDGEIIVNDTNGQGSEYAFVLNLEVPKKNGKEFKADNTTKQKALIVDDNKLNLLVADKILSKENFECTTIDNGFDAIKLANDNSYDIILMDINMPKLNGIGTTKRIREFDDETPIIALTAVDVTQLNKQILQAGLSDYILKPYDKNILLDMIYKHIHHS
ncbi:response regulator [Aquimarina sp. RZ0]|uniref:response regulator n=1 Tax=Aquimarina sp. RZ0 TaxID=2607730 RepID=UPI0011F3181F|nr:response regulator [Aquimarina sp. RZ0]KAA1246890.1 response regulator [Aquimarina sp. RZ0]